MRVVVVFVILLVANVTKAQSGFQPDWLPGTYVGDVVHPVPHYDSTGHSKWSFSRYVSLSTGYSFFKGGNLSFVAAPVGWQVNRSLSNHFTAFAGVAVVPTYFNFNSTFAPNAFAKTNANSAFLKSGNLGMYSKVELGLMYTNEAKTFSISGSIGVQRSNVPFMYPATNTKGKAPAYFSQ